MQKTFNVWVKKCGNEFLACSKKVERGAELVNAAQDEVNGGTLVYGCDVSRWLNSLALVDNQVKSFKLTLKEN